MKKAAIVERITNSYSQANVCSFDHKKSKTANKNKRTRAVTTKLFVCAFVRLIVVFVYPKLSLNVT